MTYKEWEWELRYLLGELPQKEIDEITGYYREIYGDKKEAGFSDTEIIVEFGTPKECALKIKEESEIAEAENVRATSSENNLIKEQETQGQKQAVVKNESKFKPWTVGEVLLTVFAIFPLTLIIFSVVAGLAASVVGCAVGAAGGVLTLPWAIIQMLIGNGFIQWLGFAGMGIAATGLLIPITIGLTYATKHLAIFYLKFLKKIYLVEKGGDVNEAD